MFLFNFCDFIFFSKGPKYIILLISIFIFIFMGLLKFRLKSQIFSFVDLSFSVSFREVYLFKLLPSISLCENLVALKRTKILCFGFSRSLSTDTTG